ncbi:MAG: hypothetical protein MRY74_13290 [Neomegalonema sp.]|nr:hypothetical protein [Neomegalonema sp.]
MRTSSIFRKDIIEAEMFGLWPLRERREPRDERCCIDGALELCREQQTDCDCLDDGRCWRIDEIWRVAAPPDLGSEAQRLKKTY